MEPAFRRRVLLTFAPALLLLVAAHLVPLPGVDVEELSPLTTADVDPMGFGPFALGVVPLLTGYVLVELVALVVPSLARRRHDPTMRAKLVRAARALALVFAVVEAYSIAVSMEAFAPSLLVTSGWRTTLLVTASLASGAAVVTFAADLVTRQGVVNGIVLFAALWPLPSLVRGVVTAFARARIMSQVETTMLGLASAIALTSLATWLVLRPAPARARSGSDAPYRDAAPPVVEASAPLPLGTIAAHTFVTGLLAMTSFLPPEMRRRAQLFEGATYQIVVLVLTMALALGLARALARPADAAALATRLGLVVEGGASSFERAMRAGVGQTAAYFAALGLASLVATRSTGAVSLAGVPFLTAAAIDVVRGVRTAGWVPVVAEERRAWALPVLASALEAHGIPTRTRGGAVLRLLQVFAPYAPAALLVRAEDETRARALLSGDESPAAVVAPATPSAPPEATSTSRRRTLVFAAVGVTFCCVGLTTFLSMRGESLTALRTTLEVVAVEDDDGREIFLLTADEIPEGFVIAHESVFDPETGSKSRLSPYLRATRRDGESDDDLFARAEDAARVVPGLRLAWELERLGGGIDGEPESTVIRSHVVTGGPIVTTADIRDARPLIGSGADDVHLEVELTRAGGERFAEAPRARVGRRIAIVIGGRVLFAPTVREPITDGRFTFPMNRDARGKDPYHAAAALAAGLTGRSPTSR